AEETTPSFIEDIFGRKYPILSPKHEDFPLLVSPGVSGQLNGNVKRFELESNISENGTVLGYETRKAGLINLEIGQLREATQLLNGGLASLNRPDALEESQGQALPPSLKERATYVRTSGGIESIDRQLKEQQDMLASNDEILTKIDQMLRDEKASDDQLRAQFGSKWTRATSDSNGKVQN
ncbi:hypothetical protein QYM36_017769, partial [Artemia franciscana]